MRLDPNEAVVVADELKGKRVAFLFTEGAEQAEVTEPLKAVKKAGADVDIVSLENGDVQVWQRFDRATRSRPTRLSRTRRPPITTASCCRVSWPVLTS